MNLHLSWTIRLTCSTMSLPLLQNSSLDCPHNRCQSVDPSKFLHHSHTAVANTIIVIKALLTQKEFHSLPAALCPFLRRKYIMAHISHLAGTELVFNIFTCFLLNSDWPAEIYLLVCVMWKVQLDAAYLHSSVTHGSHLAGSQRLKKYPSYVIYYTVSRIKACKNVLKKHTGEFYN